jgi:chemotaxis protein methyltransferase CheR
LPLAALKKIMSMTLLPSSLNLRKTPPLTNQEFEDLRRFIYSLTGIHIPEKRKYLLENRLGSRIKDLGLKSFAEYHRFLRSDPGRVQEIEILCEKITTNETSFFRDTRQLKVVQDHVLSPLLAQKQASGKKELRIWSAGCSSGEEPYTLAMMLHEALRLSIIGWDIRISANDISRAVLAKASRGIYTAHALRTTPEDILTKYFTPEARGYKIHPKVQKMVSFSRINLNERAEIKKVPKSEIIFCRNVIIYFDEAMKKKVINAFYDNLLPGGVLVLGHSESIHKISRAFKPIIKQGGMFYQKLD